MQERKQALMYTEGKRLIVDPAGQVHVETYEVPAPGPNQILVKVTVSQVSAGSEMNGIRRRRSASEAERQTFSPNAMGYTTIGRVEALGPNVTGYTPGERVLCKGNHGSHWMVTLPQSTVPPAISEKDVIQRVPDGPTDAEAAFAVLGDIALHGVRLGQIQLGESVAVYGAGTIGNIAMQLARISGAYPVIGVDMVENRLQIAKSLGASHTVNLSQGDPVSAIRALTEIPFRWPGEPVRGLEPGAGADVQIHCTSNIKAYPTMIKAAADRGRLILIGATSGTVEIDSNELFRRELTIRGSYETGMGMPHPYWPWSRPRNHHTIWDLMARGQLNVKPLMTHVVSYTKAPAMYDMMMDPGAGWMSVAYTWES